MKRAILFLLLASAFAASSSARAQGFYPYRVSALFGVGGVVDNDVSSGYSNSTFQLGFSFETEQNTLVGLRYAQLDFGDGLNDDGLGSAELSYATVVGEYRFNEGYYQSGIYLGLGGYNLERVGPMGVKEDDTGIGVALGVTGEFEISGRWAFLVELSGHWADVDAVNFFVLGHAGIVVKW